VLNAGGQQDGGGDGQFTVIRMSIFHTTNQSSCLICWRSGKEDKGKKQKKDTKKGAMR